MIFSMIIISATIFLWVCQDYLLIFWIGWFRWYFEKLTRWWLNLFAKRESLWGDQGNGTVPVLYSFLWCFSSLFPFPKTGQLWSLGDALLALAGGFAILRCEKYPQAMMNDDPWFWRYIWIESKVRFSELFAHPALPSQNGVDGSKYCVLVEGKQKNHS